jgi:hypothetical protein
MLLNVRLDCPLIVLEAFCEPLQVQIRFAVGAGTDSKYHSRGFRLLTLTEVQTPAIHRQLRLAHRAGRGFPLLDDTVKCTGTHKCSLSLPLPFAFLFFSFVSSLPCSLSSLSLSLVFFFFSFRPLYTSRPNHSHRRPLPRDGTHPLTLVWLPLS